ncbi:hypothetical protein GCK72_017920 [Caenorhabditis remanei]|uniref:Uncharacterized protein n=1 Tax=Caenorhabditis remanei TaxID=31234 RepID=E3LUS6_CAERE|nr:hypothetical protein GCK72_017920 [Caenorhabditis remanei]EFP11301.1 hypothetical protein CRE_31127 [Caenorhabditis remanei]KAF1751366.1 hypothetical protein GCK72_017920 [Caenorhabditis remanei]
MDEFSKKQSTRVSSRNSQKDSPPVPQRELKKRKNVHFEDQKTEYALSTSEFVMRANKQWTFVATCFNLRDDNRTASRDGDKELLELCNYYEEEESVPDLDDDSDDSIPFEIFAEQGMRITWTPGTSHSTVSTLRLSSMLRLESRQQIDPSYEEPDDVPQDSLLSEKEDMETAFQGELQCSNAQKVNRSRGSSKTEKTEEFESSENFWDGVEF